MEMHKKIFELDWQNTASVKFEEQEEITEK